MRSRASEHEAQASDVSEASPARREPGEGGRASATALPDTVEGKRGAPQPRTWVNVTIICVAVLIAACSPAAAKSAVNDLPPFTMMVARFFGMTLLMWLTWPFLRRFEPQAGTRIAGEDYPAILGAALVFVPVNQSLFLNGLRFGSATHAGLLSGLNPLFTYLLTWWTGAGVVSRRMTLAILLGFLGAGAIGWESARAKTPSAAQGGLGDLLIVGSVLTWASYSVLTLPLSLRYGPIRFLMVVTTVGLLLAAPLALLDMHELDLSKVTASGWIGFAFITVCTGYVNSILWFLGASRMEINRFALAMNANPVLAVIVAHFVHAEPVTAWLIAGGVCIIGAILLANWEQLRRLSSK